MLTHKDGRLFSAYPQSFTDFFADGKVGKCEIYANENN